MRNLYKIGIALGIACLAFPQVSFAQTAPQKQKYVFKQTVTPEILLNNYCATYYTAGNQAFTCQGHKLGQFKNGIIDFVFSPASINYILISRDKKEPIAAVFSPDQEDNIKHTFKNKKYGVPHAAAYTPDARKILLASDNKINVFDARTFQLLDTLPTDMTPYRMSMSNNGYFIVMNDGKNVCVYNYEEKKPRKTLNFDALVTDAKFNDDASELGVLTEDGLFTIYDTRNFLIKKTIDDIDNGIAFDYNSDGKYVAIVTAPDKIEVINLLDTNDRETVNCLEGYISDVEFVPDVENRPILMYNSLNKLCGERMSKLHPFYGRLISDEANEMLNEWMKMQPGETMEQYSNRVTDETRRRQLRLFEDEISTRYANDMLTMSDISLGNYDRTNQLLELSFDNMPPIYLSVPEGSLGNFTSVNDLEFRNAKYGITPDDKFELIYAEVYNKTDGKTYIYDNVDRQPLNFIQDEDNSVAIEVIQQQIMEEVKLQEIKKNVVEEAKQQNVISDHTNISVDSRVEPSYDSNGNKILNYKVKFTYEVDPAFTTYEDFAPGKYHAEQSGAASSMLKIVKNAFEGDFAQYLKEGKKVLVKISGTADATPIVSTIKYDGSYGEFDNEPVYKDGQLTGLSVNTKEPVRENEQLAFLRAVGVKNFLEKNIDKLNDMNTDYQYNIAVSNDKGSQFRRITTEFIFIDAFEQ